MALRVPVFEKVGIINVDPNCYHRIPFKLNSFQILFVCIGDVVRGNRTISSSSEAVCYYIYNALQEDNAIDGPHPFPEPIRVQYKGRRPNHHVAFNHKTRTIYILNREGHLVGFNIDTQSLHTLSRSDRALSHLDLRYKFTMIFCVNGILYRLVEDSHLDRESKNNLFLRWDPMNREFQLISTSPKRWSLYSDTFVAVPSDDILLAVHLESVHTKRRCEYGLPPIEVHRLYLKTGRRDTVSLRLDCDRLGDEILHFMSERWIQGKVPVLTTNSKCALVVGYHSVLQSTCRSIHPSSQQYAFIALNLSDQYTVDYSNDVNLRGLITKHFGEDISYYQLVGAFGSNGVLAEGFRRETIPGALPEVIGAMIEMYLCGERVDLVTFPIDGSSTKEVHASISVNHIMKGRVRVANQSEIIEIEHEIIDQENDENDNDSSLSVRRHSF